MELHRTTQFYTLLPALRIYIQLRKNTLICALVRLITQFCAEDRCIYAIIRKFTPKIRSVMQDAQFKTKMRSFARKDAFSRMDAQFCARARSFAPKSPFRAEIRSFTQKKYAVLPNKYAGLREIRSLRQEVRGRCDLTRRGGTGPFLKLRRRLCGQTWLTSIR